MNIFQRNIGALTETEQQTLTNKKVFIAGCGGLGGYAAEYAVRSGIGAITLCDMDVFEETNLNRQRFSDIYRIGQSKADITKQKLLDINPVCKITAYNREITEESLPEMAEGCDLIIDALDNIEGRKMLEAVCEKLNIPLIFGAVSRWCGQVATVLPGDKTISAVYQNAEAEKKPPVMVMTAAVTAGYQVSEAVKVLLNKPSLKKKMLIIDLEDNTVDVLKLK